MSAVISTPRRMFHDLNSDPVLLGTLVVLLSFGLVMVYSASIAITGGSSALIKHGINIGIGLTLMFFLSRIPLKTVETLGPVLLLVGVLLISLVWIPGVGQRINGSARWLSLGGFRIQPAEIVKLAMVIYVAGYLNRRHKQITDFKKGMLSMTLVTGAVVLILLLQPDFGSGVVITATIFGMLFLAGVRLWHFLAVVSVGLAGMASLAWMAPYRVARLTTFLDPWSDVYDKGFQLVQALIAFGRGGLFGVGIGASVQKLHYLPAANTDFLLAVIGEELGFVGVLFVISLYAILVVRGFQIAARAELQRKLFVARLAQGISLLIAFQAIINIGVNLGVLPTKGLTLPFLSWGGSSMFVSCAAIGLLLRAALETGGKKRRRSR